MNITVELTIVVSFYIMTVFLARAIDISLYRLNSRYGRNPGVWWIPCINIMHLLANLSLLLEERRKLKKPGKLYKWWIGEK